MKSLVQYPLRYRLNPLRLRSGVRRITAGLKNVSDNQLVSLKVRLISRDTYGLKVEDQEKLIEKLGPGEEKSFDYRVAVRETGNLELVTDGELNGRDFHSESGFFSVRVGARTAELAGLFALSEPYPPVDKPVRIEAIVEGRRHNGDLHLHFWIESPRGSFEGLDFRRIGRLKSGEQKRLALEWTPKKEGPYTVHAVLLTGEKRLAHGTEKIWAEAKKP